MQVQQEQIQQESVGHINNSFQQSSENDNSDIKKKKIRKRTTKEDVKKKGEFICNECKNQYLNYSSLKKHFDDKHEGQKYIDFAVPDEYKKKKMGNHGRPNTDKFQLRKQLKQSNTECSNESQNDEENQVSTLKPIQLSFIMEKKNAIKVLEIENDIFKYFTQFLQQDEEYMLINKTPQEQRMLFQRNDVVMTNLQNIMEFSENDKNIFINGFREFYKDIEPFKQQFEKQNEISEQILTNIIKNYEEQLFEDYQKPENFNIQQFFYMIFWFLNRKINELKMESIFIKILKCLTLNKVNQDTDLNRDKDQFKISLKLKKVLLEDVFDQLQQEFRDLMIVNFLKIQQFQ